MTIYILHSAPALSAQYLDDRSLDKQIRDIAQVLCNVHILALQSTPAGRGYRQSQFDGYTIGNNDSYYKRLEKIPLNKIKNEKLDMCRWSHWASQCKANYLWMVEYGIKSCDEHARRFFKANKIHPIVKYENIIAWARDNVPDLPDHILLSKPPQPAKPEPFPLVMPKRYILLNQCDGCLSGNHKPPYPSGGMVCESDEYAIQSCRNYYQAKLSQIINRSVICCNCDGNYSDYYGDGYPCDQCKLGKQYPNKYWLTFSNRNVPDWLEL